VGALTGGYLAARLALDHPDRIRGAVLLDTRAYVPYRSLSTPDKPVSMEERHVILTTRPATMGILLDLSPQVMLSPEASGQLVNNLPPQQRQSALYSNLRDIERGKALFINNTFNTDSRTFRYNIELNGVDLSDSMKNLKASLLFIAAIHDDNSPGQGGAAPSQWNEIKLR
jgi:pimeloyl-ACP methyl ester carboxylesterase